MIKRLWEGLPYWTYSEKRIVKRDNRLILTITIIIERADLYRIALTGMVTAPFTRFFSSSIGENISTRKFAQYVPVASSLKGSSFNCWFISNTSRAAFMVFRKLYIERKH